MDSFVQDANAWTDVFIRVYPWLMRAPSGGSKTERPSACRSTQEGRSFRQSSKDYLPFFAAAFFAAGLAAGFAAAFLAGAFLVAMVVIHLLSIARERR